MPLFLKRAAKAALKQKAALKTGAALIKYKKKKGILQKQNPFLGAANGT